MKFFEAFLVLRGAPRQQIIRFFVRFSFFGSPQNTVMFFRGSKGSKHLMSLVSFSFFGSPPKAIFFWGGSQENSNLNYLLSVFYLLDVQKNSELLKGFRWASIGAAFVQEVGHTRATCFIMFRAKLNICIRRGPREPRGHFSFAHAYFSSAELLGG